MVAAFNPALLVLQYSSTTVFRSILVIALLLGATFVVMAMLYIKMKRLTLEVKKANQAKLEFLTTMSHELRTPLNAIAGYTELLLLGLRGPLTTEQREDLSRIQRNQRQLLSLINDILNFTKLGVGNITYSLSDVPLASTIRAAYDFIEPRLREKNITYEAVGLTDTIAVVADDEKLYHVFVNLFSNAVKFTRRGGRVTVTCTHEVKSRIVRIAIADTGIGIPTDKLVEIFDPFMQVDTSLTREHSGVGLGLSISRNLVLGMNGDLLVESTLGEGSTFTVVLPSATHVNPSAEVASPDTYSWPDRSTLQAPASQHVLAP
jgi:signal transduction histidine kinase